MILRKTFIFIAGILVGFLFMEAIRFFAPNENLAKSIVNPNFYVFFSQIFTSQTIVVSVCFSILYFINALTFCIPLGLLAGIFLSKIKFKRLFTYPIFIGPIAVTILNIYLFSKERLLAAILGRPDLIIKSKDLHIINMMNIVICYAVFFTGIYLGHLWFTKRQQKRVQETETENPEPQIEQNLLG